MLIWHSSNRLERLAEILAEQMAADPLPPLQQEQVLVGSVGIGRWLSLRLADHLGICAQVDFPLPGRFIWALWSALLGGLPEQSPFAVPVLRWRIYDLLTMAPPLAFAAYAADPLRRLQLAEQLAELYDRYLLYRPDWLEHWEAGGGEALGALWRQLLRPDLPHRGRLWAAAQAVLEGGARSAALPRRIWVFGLSTLPPILWQGLRGIAEQRPVHVFFLNPCQEYWGDIVAPRSLARAAARGGAGHTSSGNALLASWGQQGRDFFDLILEEADPVTDEAFVEPAGEGLLATLQRDILYLRDGPREEGPRDLSAADRSLQVHAAHSPLRELEILQDRLLALFQQDASLQPEDILVMTPDLPCYAPLIEAVFGTVPAARHIPYRVVDAPLAAAPVVGAWDAFLTLLDGPWPASAVLDLLERPPVAGRFGLSPGDMAVLRGWVPMAGIHWGRETWPHGWRAGLDRLLLGCALPAESPRLFAGLLPRGALAAPDQLRLLGMLVEVLTQLFAAADALTAPRSLGQWVRDLLPWLERLFAADEDRERLRAELLRLGEEAEGAAMGSMLPFAVLRAHLRERLQQSDPQQPMLSGGVTFAAMVPMRSLPARVVALLGLNGDSFPRQQRQASFDAMAREWRRGDRSRRQDDRYLFLEALLSARDCLLLSYVGRDIRDDGERPPSVLLSELLDYIDRHWQAPPPHDRASAAVCVQHPLQAFSRSYFAGDPRLSSYAREIAEALNHRDAMAPTFVSQPLPGDARGVVELADLLAFWQSPSAYFCRRRLGMQLQMEADVPQDQEPFVLDGLQGWGLEQEILRLQRQGVDAGQALAILAQGILPPAGLGAVAYWQREPMVARFAQRLAETLPAAAQAADLDLLLGGYRLQGLLTGIGPSGLVLWQLSGLKAELWLRFWILHLLAQRGVGPCPSRFLHRDGCSVLPALDGAAAEATLITLLDYFTQGQSFPLPFFPRTAMAYAESALQGSPPDPATLPAWRGSGRSGNGPPGEAESPAVRLAFRGRDPLQDPFAEIALAVWGPLLAVREQPE